jgi:hypothetical protein
MSMLSDVAQIISAVGGIVSPIVLVMLTRQNKEIKVQSEKLEAVHLSTNGLALRNEAIAKKLGVEEGTAAGLAQGRAEEKQSQETQ